MAGKNRVDFKIVMLGRQAVGKSAVVDRFTNDRWTPGAASTIGGSFCAKELSVPSAATGSSGKAPPAQSVTVGIWDTAGSERYESLTRHYFSQAEAAFCCFDLTELASWQKVQFWIHELQKVEPNCRIYIIGCKADLVQPNQATHATRTRGSSMAPSGQRARCVSKHEVETFCESVEPECAQYFETSALTGAGIHQAFQAAATDWVAKPKPEKDYAAGNIALDDRNDRKRRAGGSVCCNQ